MALSWGTAVQSYLLNVPVLSVTIQSSRLQSEMMSVSLKGHVCSLIHSQSLLRRDILLTCAPQFVTIRITLEPLL